MIIGGIFLSAGIATQVVTNIEFTEASQPPASKEMMSTVAEDKRPKVEPELSTNKKVEGESPINVESGSSEKTLEWIKSGNVEIQEETGRVRFHMKQGQLLPQVKELAKHLPGVSKGKGWWQWKAPLSHEWPNDVTLKAESIDALMLSIVDAYKLTMEVKGNGVVHVKD